MSKKKKSLNGIQVFGGATVILFAAVFFLSKIQIDIFTGNDKADSDIVADSSVGVTDVLAENGDPFPENGDPFPENGIGDNITADSVPDEDTIPDDAISDTEYPADELPAPKPDPDEADNTWAMILVNADNAVSQEYCDSVETEWVFENYRPYYMDSRMAEYMKEMIQAAEEDGHQLVVMSAYRSFERQQELYEESVTDRMERLGMTEEEARVDALREVQLPGCSEHNTGLAADIMSDEYYSMDDDGFKDTSAYAWLVENAPKYGFILRYPEGGYEETKIGYEPWHFRFVGVYYAQEITRRGITLEEYFREMNWVDENGKVIYHLPAG